MEVRDLRIGNLLLNFQDKVESVSGNDLKIWEAYGIPHDKIKPIKLTPDWLEKLEFETVDDQAGIYKSPVFDEPHDKRIIVYLNEVEARFMVNKGFVKCFQSVHQLQNLYHSLTGEDLKVKEPA